MTQQEFVKKESERIIEEDWKDPSSPEDFVSMGLTKGLEIAKDFSDWIGFNYNQGSDGWYFMYGDDTKTYTTEELLTIFLTEKYGK